MSQSTPLPSTTAAAPSAPRLTPRPSGGLRNHSSTISRNSTSDTLTLGDLFGTRAELSDLRDVLAAGPPTRSPSRASSRRSSLTSPAANASVSPRLSRTGIVEVDSRPLLRPRSRDNLLPPSPVEAERFAPPGRLKPSPRPANIVDPPRIRNPSHSVLRPRDSRVGLPERPPVSYNRPTTSHNRRLSLIEVLADKGFAANPANVIVRDLAQSRGEEEHRGYDHGDDESDCEDAVSIAQRREFEFWHEVLRHTGPEDKIHPSGIATSTVDVGKYQTPPPTPTLAKGQPKLRKSPSLAQSVLKLLSRSKPAHDVPPSPQLPAGYQPKPTASAPSSVSKSSTRSSVGSSAPLLGRSFPSFRKDKGEMTGSVKSPKSRNSRADEPARAYTPSVHSYAPSHTSRHEGQVINVNVNLAPSMLAATPTLAPAPTSRPASTRSRPTSVRSVAAPVAPAPAPVAAPAVSRPLPNASAAPARAAPVRSAASRKPSLPSLAPLAPLVAEVPVTIATLSSTPTSSVLLGKASPQVAKLATRTPAPVVIVKPVPASAPEVVMLRAAATPAAVSTPAAAVTPSVPLVKEVSITMPPARPPPRVVAVPAVSRPASRIAVGSATLAATTPALAQAPAGSPVVIVPASAAPVTPPAVVAPVAVTVPPAAVPVTVGAAPVPPPAAPPAVVAPAVSPVSTAVPPPVPTPAPATATPVAQPAPHIEITEKHIDVITPQGDVIEKVTRTTRTTAAVPKTPSVAPAPSPRPAPQLVVNKPIQHVVNTPLSQAQPPATISDPAPPTTQADRVEVVEKIIVPAGAAPEEVEKALDTLNKIEAAETKSSDTSKPLPDLSPKNAVTIAPGSKAGIEPIKMVDYKSLIKPKLVKPRPPPKPISEPTVPIAQQSLPKRTSSTANKTAAAPSPTEDPASVPLPPSPIKNPASVPLPPSPIKNPASIPLPASPVKNPASVPLPPSPVKPTSKASSVSSKHEKEKAPSVKPTSGEVVISIGKDNKADVEATVKPATKATSKDAAPKSNPGEITISIGKQNDKPSEKVEASTDTPPKATTDGIKAEIELKGSGASIELATAAAVQLPPSRPGSIRSIRSTNSRHRTDSVKSTRSVRSVHSAIAAAAETRNVTITTGGTKIEVAVPEPQKAGSVPLATLPALATLAGSSKHRHSASTPSLAALKKEDDEVESVDKTLKGEVTTKIHSYARRGSAPASVVGEGKKKSKGEEEKKQNTLAEGQSDGHKHDKEGEKVKAVKTDKNDKTTEDKHGVHNRKDSQKLAPKEVVHEADSDLEIDFVEKKTADGKQTTIAIRRRFSQEESSLSREGSPSKSHHHHHHHRHERNQSPGQHHAHERRSPEHHHGHVGQDWHNVGHGSPNVLGQHHHSQQRHHRTRSSMDSKRHYHHHRPSSGEDSDSDGSFYSTRSRSSRHSRGGSFDIPRPPVPQHPYLAPPILSPGAGAMPVPSPMHSPGVAAVPGMPGMVNLHGMAAGVGVPGIGYASGHPIVVPMGSPMAAVPVPPVAFSAVPAVPGVPMGWAGVHGAPQYPMGPRPPPGM